MFSGPSFIIPSALLIELLLDAALPPKGIFVRAGFLGGMLLLDWSPLVLMFEVGIEDGFEALRADNDSFEFTSPSFGCNAFGASLAFPFGRDEVTVGGEGVNDLDAFDDELDKF